MISWLRMHLYLKSELVKIKRLVLTFMVRLILRLGCGSGVGVAVGDAPSGRGGTVLVV